MHMRSVQKPRVLARMSFKSNYSIQGEDLASQLYLGSLQKLLVQYFLLSPICGDFVLSTGTNVIKHFYAQRIMLINVIMPIIVGILTFVSMINTTYESLKAR